ncbi:MAG: GNAT family N-acetyltransferase [Thaumarchaeota archaeon]|nr:GNAT family N-acetyltransferase [Nitrososphaerota archaeon]MDG6994472.1 GNAT family N-acetyltransferase [Nitrososphaerota archaeon]
MNDLVIRRATKKDSQGFLKLLVSLANFEHLKSPSSAAKKRILRDVFSKKINLFIASIDSTAVGYALYFYTYSSFLAKPTLYLEDIFVLQDFRGQGVGKQLFLKCAREAVKQGCGRMEWSVLTWNRNAIRFYEKLGAKRLKEWYYYRLDSDTLKTLSK